MNTNSHFPLPAPRVPAVLDPGFRPAVLATRAFAEMVASTGAGVPVRLALEQTDGSVFHFETAVLPSSHPQVAANDTHVERLVKFLLWSRGGWRIYVDGPPRLAAALSSHYATTAPGRFDADFVGRRVFDHPVEVVATPDLPPDRPSPLPRRS